VLGFSVMTFMHGCIEIVTPRGTIYLSKYSI